MVKNLPAMQENQVQSLGQEDPLAKAKYKLQHHLAPHSSDLTTGWSIHGEEPRIGLSHTSLGVGMLVGGEHSRGTWD